MKGLKFKISRILFSLLVFSAFISFSGCSLGNAGSSVMQTSLIGGVAGSALGAGAGALVGSAISNGDIGASALLGAGIGLPAGMLLGAVYMKNEQDSVLEDNAEQIQSNQEHIIQNEKNIDELRGQFSDDSFAIELDEEQKEELYIGPSAGNPFR